MAAFLSMRIASITTRLGSTVLLRPVMACLTAMLVANCGTPPQAIPGALVEPAVARGVCLVQVHGSELQIVGLNGHTRRRSVPFHLSSKLSHLERVSPTGMYLVSSSLDFGSVGGIDLDGRLLWQVRNARVSRPAISPDGSQVVLISNSDRTLAVYDVPSGQLRMLGFAGNNPVFAPTGDRLAYDDGANLRIHDLTNHTTVDRGPGTEPSWLADGKSVAVRLEARVDVVDLATGERTELFADARRRSVPRWSQDGEWMMYTRYGSRSWWQSVSAGFAEPRQVVLRHVGTGAEAWIAEIYKANPGDFTWTRSSELCR